ncbi:MAG: hypothetical protein EA408_02525 [Marinilabiliales bacterium]|nr:MAG: hypothetical protein EA408_02525 [Marinilabiliales bacterium]
MEKSFTPQSKLMVLLPVILVWVLCSCGNRKTYDFSRTPSFSGDNVNAVIEIPAGTNRIITWDPGQRAFITGQQEHTGREMVDFLPFPANYGFVPGTFTDPVLGGDGRPVGIMVICESLPTGTLIEVVPVLVFYFDDDEGPRNRLTDPVVLAVPASKTLRVIQAVTYEELFDDYPDIVDIVVRWFTSCKGKDVRQLRAMGDGDVALNEIKKWEVRRF